MKFTAKRCIAKNVVAPQSRNMCRGEVLPKCCWQCQCLVPLQFDKGKIKTTSAHWLQEKPRSRQSCIRLSKENCRFRQVAVWPTISMRGNIHPVQNKTASKYLG